MFSLRRKPTKLVKLDIVNAIELKKDCNYILVADSRHLSEREMKEIMKSCNKVGVKNVVGFMMNGGDKQPVMLIDRPKPKRAPNGKFTKEK